MGCASDAAALSTFARDAFESAFGPQNTASDMASYLSTAFSPAIQAAELANPTLQVFLAERQGGGIVGYAVTVDAEPDAAVADKTALELKRLYGIGVGAALMNRCLEYALWLGRRSVWLGVWEHNPRAIAFYKRFGFVDVGSHDFPLGEDMQTDRIMLRTVDPLNPPVEATSAGSSAASPTPPAASAAAARNGSTSPFLFDPLPADHPLSDRVLDAFACLPRFDLEREFGCSVLQVACRLRVLEAQVADAAAQLAEKGKLKLTREGRYKYVA